MSVDAKQNKVTPISKGKNSAIGFAKNISDLTTTLGKDEMDWKGETSVGDSDVLRDLHLNIQKFSTKAKLGEAGETSGVTQKPKEDGNLYDVLSNKGQEGPEKSKEEICMGSEQTPAEAVSQ